MFATNRQFDSCKPLHDGKPANVAATCIGGFGETTVAMAADNNPEQTDEAIFREYIQLMLAAGARTTSVVEDGLAELFSTFKMTVTPSSWA